MTWRLDPARLPSDTFRHDEATGRFTVVIPEWLNIAEETVGRHARGPLADKVALVFVDESGTTRNHTYADLDRASTRLAAALRRRGIRRGDRLAVHTGQRPETVIAHLAAYKLGAIAATVSQLTGPDTMAYILADCGARVVITQDIAWSQLRLRTDLNGVEQVVVVGDREAGEISFDALAGEAAGDFSPEQTRAEDPALLIYTSGSTGQPKGILHAHRILAGLNATLELFYNLELRQEGLVFWTAADWAWIGGLNDVVLPALAFGHTLIATQHRYEPEWALGFMAHHKVSHTLLTPTALKRIAKVHQATQRYDLHLRVIVTGGESLPGETHKALSDNLGVVCNEGYGQSEVNQMIGNCQRLRAIRPGSMGWEFPGHRVALLDEEGAPVADGEVGEVCVANDSPTLFLGYWGNAGMTRSLQHGDGWVRTHDLAVRDEDGYYWYRGRNDDLIKSAGFRIGPIEIEETLVLHPAVAEAGVIGVPDEERGAAVKAFIRLRPGHAPSDALADELRQHVKSRIGPYKQPRLIEFIDELPITGTGKLSRAQLRSRDARTHEKESS